jgi:hypothetical protein
MIAAHHGGDLNFMPSTSPKTLLVLRHQPLPGVVAIKRSLTVR